MLFLSFIGSIFVWNIPLVLEEICSLSHSIDFPLFLCIGHLQRLSYLSLLFSGTLRSVRYIFPFLLCLSLLFFSQLFVRPPQTTTLPSCISFSWGWFWSFWRRRWQPIPIFLPGEFRGHRSLAGCRPWGHRESDKTEQLSLTWSLPPVQYYKSPSMVFRHSVYQIVPWIYSSPPLYNHNVFDRSYMNGLVVFPTFFNLSLNLQLEANVLSHSQLQSVCWLYRASPSLDAKNIINMMSREYICGADRSRFTALSNVTQVVSNWAAIFAVNLFYFFHLYMTLSPPKPCTSLANRRVSVCACSALSDSLRPSRL